MRLLYISMKNCTIYQKQIESWGAKREQKKKLQVPQYHPPPSAEPLQYGLHFLDTLHMD